MTKKKKVTAQMMKKGCTSKNTLKIKIDYAISNGAVKFQSKGSLLISTRLT